MILLLILLGAAGGAVIIWAGMRDLYHSPLQAAGIGSVRALFLLLMLSLFYMWPGHRLPQEQPDSGTVFALVDQAALTRPALMDRLEREIDSFRTAGARTRVLLYNTSGEVSLPASGERWGVWERYATLPMALTRVRWQAATSPVPGILYVSPRWPDGRLTDLLPDIPARWIGDPFGGNKAFSSLRLPAAVLAARPLEVVIETAPGIDRERVQVLVNGMETGQGQPGGDSGARLRLPGGPPGSLELRVRLSGPGDKPEEEHLYNIPSIAAPAVWQVTMDGGPTPLTRLLKQSGIQVKMRSPSILSGGARDLQPAGLGDMVILDGLAPGMLGPAAADALKSFVADRGGRLMFVTGSELDRSAAGTPVEGLLPVKFGREPGGEEGDRLALVCIVDTSWSMYFTAAGMTGHSFTEESYTYNKLNMAKRALANITGALRPDDIFGLLTVKDHPSWALSPAAGRPPAVSEDVISRIEADGPGINLYSGLLEAYSKLKTVEAPVKHVLVFLDTADVDEYQVTGTGTVWELVQQYNEAGITVSLIGFGRAGDKDITDINRLADLSGGYFYLTSDIKEIPGFSMRDVEQISSSLLDYQARDTEHLSTDLPTVDKLPGIRGQVMTTLKPGARLLAWSRKGYPLLAAWTLGRGAVSVFTADSGRSLAPEWFRDDDPLWDKLLPLLAEPGGVREGPFVQEEPDGRRLFVRSLPGAELPEGSWSSGTTGGPLEFVAASGGLFRADLPDTAGQPMIVTVDGERGSAKLPSALEVPAASRTARPPVLTQWSLTPPDNDESPPAQPGPEPELLVLLILLCALLLAVDELSRAY